MLALQYIKNVSSLSLGLFQIASEQGSVPIGPRAAILKGHVLPAMLERGCVE